LNYAHLGKKQEALADMQALQAERANPTPEIFRCKAEIAYFNGDMKTAEAEFGRAISSGDMDARTYFERAMANYALGKWREAAEGFAQAYERFADPQDKARADIMRMIALRRQNPRGHVTAQSTAQDGWLGIMLAAVEGSKNDDDVLREVHHRTDDEMEYALSDAYYYLAQLNGLAGNRIKALVYLERSVDKGILQSAYRPAARLEFERLRH
jgi:tetratricopeptide (TPR) repeat protein